MCDVFTECKGTQIINMDGFTSICEIGDACRSMRIFDYSADTTDQSAALTYYFCWTDWPAETVYRNLGVATITTAEPADIKTTSTVNPMSTATSDVPPSPAVEPEAPSSNAWIAGAVVGPIAVVALIAVAFWYGRRQGSPMKDKRLLEADQKVPLSGSAGGGNPVIPPGPGDNSMELAAINDVLAPVPIYEMPPEGAGYSVRELPA